MQNDNLEIELKFQISAPELENIQSTIKKLGYVFQRRRYEKNSMYDNDKKVMQQTNGRIRLRISGDHYELCYKKPIKDESGIKKEIEYETTIGDPVIINKILTMMEFYEVSSYERYRTTYTHIDNPIKITIDEFPFGVFLEIEGEEESIKVLAQKLGFNLSNNLIEPCDTLFNERRKLKGLGETMIMSFDTYDKP